MTRQRLRDRRRRPGPRRRRPASRPAKPDQTPATRQFESRPAAGASVNFEAAGLLDGVERRARAARERLLRELLEDGFTLGTCADPFCDEAPFPRGAVRFFEDVQTPVAVPERDSRFSACSRTQV
jgi:hypothetical protein